MNPGSRKSVRQSRNRRPTWQDYMPSSTRLFNSTSSSILSNSGIPHQQSHQPQHDIDSTTVNQPTSSHSHVHQSQPAALGNASTGEFVTSAIDENPLSVPYDFTPVLLPDDRHNDSDEDSDDGVFLVEPAQQSESNVDIGSGSSQQAELEKDLRYIMRNKLNKRTLLGVVSLYGKARCTIKKYNHLKFMLFAFGVTDNLPSDSTLRTSIWPFVIKYVFTQST